MLKQQLFALFQSCICSNSIHRYATSVNPTPGTTETRTVLSISRKSGIYATKITTTSVSFVCTSISFRPLRTQEKREELFSYQFLNLKNQVYLYLPTYPLNSFRFFRFLLQPRFCLCNMPFLIFYTPSRDKTHVCFHKRKQNTRLLSFFPKKCDAKSDGKSVSLSKFN